MGKTLKLEGIIKHSRRNDKDFYYVYRKSLGCCGGEGEVRFEISWDPGYQGFNAESDKGKYPKDNDWVEVQGELKIYEISGFSTLFIALSELNVKEKRGSEWVIN